MTSISRCNATNTTGCRAEAPTVPDHEYLMTADPATNTIYAGNDNRRQIDVINGATCHAGQLAGCAPVATIPMANPQANVGSIDHATHTLYASNPSSDTVAVINTATCNAQTRPAARSIRRPSRSARARTRRSSTRLPDPVRVLQDGSRVAVVNAATCNAERDLRLRAGPGRGQGRGGHFASRSAPPPTPSITAGPD